MLAVIGTVPDADFPLIHGRARLDRDFLVIEGHEDRRVPVNRGTPALLGAALKAAGVLREIGAAGGSRDADFDVYAFLVGDIGHGDGSRRLYDFLSRSLPEFNLQTMVFHYLQPDVDWHGKVLFAIEEMPSRPFLIADAGFMYAAKMSGQAPDYDFFTPDAGELAFLADETAPHPFYTRGFILQDNHPVPELIRRACLHNNAARHLLVKGRIDYITRGDQIISTVDQPASAAMEAIGGTGDTLTGLLAVLCRAGYDPVEAADLAARINRWCGYYAEPTPATQVMALIDRIPRAVKKVLSFKC